MPRRTADSHTARVAKYINRVRTSTLNRVENDEPNLTKLRSLVDFEENESNMGRGETS